MTKWTIKFTRHAEKAILKLDKQIAKRILDYMEKRVACLDDPKTIGKSLVGNKAGLWRYRVGDYRIICNIEDESLTVLVLHVGHRRSVYDEV